MSDCVGSVSAVLLLTSSAACWACEVMARAKRSGSWLSFWFGFFLFLSRMSVGFLSSVYSRSQRTRILPPTEHPAKQQRHSHFMRCLFRNLCCPVSGVILTRFIAKSCIGGHCRSSLLQCSGKQQMAESHHNWVAMIMVSKYHTNPCTISCPKKVNYNCCSKILELILNFTAL